MKSYEEFVAPQSDYFIYSPSKLAQDVLLYPMQCGIFSYMPGYSLTRESFDSFLLLYIQKGTLNLSLPGFTGTAHEGCFVLVDCYSRHSYSSPDGCECIWCHFDGITARGYCSSIISRLGNVFSLSDPHPTLSKLTAILRTFYKGTLVREPLLSKYLNDIMTDFLLYTPSNSRMRNDGSMAEEVITYINEHFKEDISVKDLADHAGLSQYHFSRVFKKETGFTPHEYLVNTRIATAKYLLKNTRLPVKDICFASGFSNESVFCDAFKRHQGMTPLQYRMEIGEKVCVHP